ncbi:MAG: hypothetical protein BroJett012_07080 [Betaproteobacteria bacterium]|nr:MAG: hypothetical protein BroJett012_07080 [Betaproteobacteria bacterium]
MFLRQNDPGHNKKNGKPGKIKPGHAGDHGWHCCQPCRVQGKQRHLLQDALQRSEGYLGVIIPRHAVDCGLKPPAYIRRSQPLH